MSWRERWREFKLALACHYVMHTGAWMAGVIPEDLVD